jgi:hypothetical protein
VVLWLIVNAVLIWVTGSRLEERLAAIRDAGDPVTLADLDRPEPPADRNAAVFLRRGRNDIDALSKELELIRSSDGNKTSIEAERKAARAAMEAYPRVIPLLEQSAACPDYRPDIDFSADPQLLTEKVIEEVQQFRLHARILRQQSILLRDQGKRDDALRASLVSLRLTRHLERAPLLITCLVEVACRSVAIGQINATLRSGAVSNDIRAELDQEMVRCDDLKSFQQFLKTERAYAITCFGSTIPVHWGNRALMNTMECNVIDGFNEQLALATQPYTAVVAAETRLKERFSGSLNALAALQLPAMLKTREAVERVRAQSRCLRVLNALQRRGLSADKEAKLSELGLPAEAITDPYDGSPIKMKQVASEWLIYCVGPDMKDDGGKLDDFSDVGIGPVKPDAR